MLSVKDELGGFAGDGGVTVSAIDADGVAADVVIAAASGVGVVASVVFTGDADAVGEIAAAALVLSAGGCEAGAAFCASVVEGALVVFWASGNGGALMPAVCAEEGDSFPLNNRGNKMITNAITTNTPIILRVIFFSISFP